MKKEPIGIAAAATGIIEWLLHEHVPEMPPGVVTAVGAVAVWLLARPFTVPHGRHVDEVAKALAEPPPKAKGTAAAGVVLLALLLGAASAEAQGIRQTLEEIGRGVAASAAREAAERLEGEQDAPPAPEAAGEPAPAPTGATDAIAGDTQDAGLSDSLLLALVVGIVLAGVLLVAVMMHRSTPAGAVKATVRQTTRVVLIATIYGVTLAGGMGIEHLEQVDYGRASVWNQAHQGIGVLEAFAGASLIVFLVYDLLLMRFFTSVELATGKPEPGREEISAVAKMSPTTRVAFIHGMYGVWVALILIYGFGIGL